MNMIVKSAVATALSLAAGGAFAMGLPSSGSSDIVLLIQNNAVPTNVYALDTGISINSVMPTSGLVSNSVLSTSIAGINSAIAASSMLQAFLAANPAAGDGWTVEAGQYTGLTNKTSNPAGNSKAIFSSGTNPGNVSSTTLALLEGFQNGYGTDVASGATGTVGLTALQTAKESTAVSYGCGAGAACTKYGVLSAADLATVGSTVALYGITGNNGLGAVQSYVLGTASLGTNGTLTLAGNTVTAPPPPVPLPAAVWLFGSGLLGLVGVSRRRKAAV
jgi:hypothetical protein